MAGSNILMIIVLLLLGVYLIVSRRLGANQRTVREVV
jgi:hypothetical protein